jgi:hypothetical protein
MTDNKQQTAVEWLSKTLRHNSVSIFSGDIADQAKNLEQVFQQAKEMEKDRMIQFARYVLWKTVATMELTIEQHYEQTYGEDE